ncbi:restriction endonuclease subunit S [Atlantibacter hermannii]|uniref:restriction endonuclease subunit S n=1 Tax=Atlantibacter hermannii TaxID=565 RepID=UPI0028B02399|nr:restriction endonuclease subunit S [Atlantibacter hermannii]
MVPKGWTLLQVSDICKLQNGNSFKPHEWDTQGLPIIRIQNLNGSDNYNYFSGVPQDKWLVEPGQLLFSWAGTKGVSFGPFIWNGPKGVLNQHIYKVFANENVHGHWLYLALLHITQKIEAQAHGFKSTLLHVQKKDIDNQFVLTPPVAEQKKIAQILSTWDKAISVTEKILANSQQQKKALMQQLLTGKKRLLDENGVRFSGDWGKFTLSHFGKCIRGVSYKPENICENESDNTIRLLRSTNIQNGELNDKDLIILPKKLVKPMQVLMDGDLAICMANGSKSLVGKSAPYKPNDADYTVGAFCALFRPLKSVSSSFVKFLFESNQYQSQLLVILAGSSINNLKGSDIESINIDAPLHYKEQQKIAAVLSAADAEISTLEKKLACLRDEKKALMQQLLTGKRRVKIDEAVAV